MSLGDFLQSMKPGGLRIIAHEQVESPTLAQIVREVEFRSATLCIGPEGGFTEAEVSLAEETGFRRASLGSRRLRTETAAILAAGNVLSF
jgi:16S rRNA (uracil1498-N3)-methyltransferase